jgi:hypothetical protein
MASLLNICRFNPTAGGASDWTYSSPVTGYQSPAAAQAVNGASYSYRAESNDLSQWEVGVGVYNAGVLTRATVLFNSSGTSARINFSAAPQVALVALAEDLVSLVAPASGAGKNIMGRNGGLEIWQRGTSVAVAASTTAYTADGWYLSTGTNQACTVARQSSASLGIMGRFSGQVQRNSGQAGTGTIVFAFPLDEDEINMVRGNQLMLSCKLLAGANWSPSSGTLTYNVYFGTGAVAKRNGVAYASESNPITGTINVVPTGAASLISAISSAVPTNVTQGEIQFKWTPSGAAGADDSIRFDDVQLEVVPLGCLSYTPVFERSSFSYDLLRCQKHYAKSFDYGTAPAQNAGITGALVAVAATASAGSISFRQYWPTMMRAVPILTTYNTNAADANWWDLNASASRAVFTGEVCQTSARIAMNATTTAGSQHFIHFTVDASV